MFKDPEDDTFLLDCSSDYQWLHFEKQTNGDYVITGTSPATNSIAGYLTIPCTLTDSWTNTRNYTFNLPLTLNTAPSIVKTPETAIVSLGS